MIREGAQAEPWGAPMFKDGQRKGCQYKSWAGVVSESEGSPPEEGGILEAKGEELMAAVMCEF